MIFTAPYGQRVRYTGSGVTLSATPPVQKIERNAVGKIRGPAVDVGFFKVQFEGVDGVVAVRGSALELLP